MLLSDPDSQVIDAFGIRNRRVRNEQQKGIPHPRTYVVDQTGTITAEIPGTVFKRHDGKKLIDCWAKWHDHDQPLESIQPGAWFWDQITLAEAWEEAGVSCAMIRMNIYGDNELWKTSSIWSAHVPQKDHYYDLFCKEYLRQCMERARC